MPGRKSIHTKKFDRCVKAVKKSKGKYNPYAVCTASIGYKGSIKKGHRRKMFYLGKVKDTKDYTFHVDLRTGEVTKIPKKKLKKMM